MNSEKLAVIETGGKQYLIKPGQTLKVEKLNDAKEGGVVDFDKVLLVANGADIKLGKPYLEGIKVSAKVIKDGRKEKIIVLRYKSKTRQRRRMGHRQHFTEVVIGEIK